MKTNRMMEKDFQEHLSKATPSKPFLFFNRVNCIYDGSKIIWRGCPPENVDKSNLDLNALQSHPDFTIDFMKGYEDRILEDVDPFSLRKINWRLLADVRYVIQDGIILKGIDGASFRSLSKSPSEIFFKDKKAVYVEKFGKLKKIDNADPETFKKIGFSYAKDKNHFFCEDVELPGLSENYTINVCGFLYDDTIIYHYDFRIDVDTKTFEILDFEEHSKATNPFMGPFLLRDKMGTYLYKDRSKELIPTDDTTSVIRNRGY
ncbi:DKNYY domain-containing protein [Leptospira interrogans]|uniref:DKNYY domain-containing protein n=1 Tax=Leptospira interrogans TaxID=173 RepID=UPI000773746E|nr:DKNYY domain-containing protein [Leptospira interrogans]